MRLTTILRLWFNFQFCQLGSSSLQEFLQLEDGGLANKIGGNILVQFFAELKKIHLDKINPQHIVIVGQSPIHPRQSKQLLNRYSFNICTQPEICTYPKQFWSGSFIVVFLEDVSKETFEKHINILTSCQFDCELFFVVEKTISRTDIFSFLTLVTARVTLYFELIELNGDVIRQHRLKFTKNCTMILVSHVAWQIGTDVNKINFIPFAIKTLNGCPLRVGATNFIPKLRIAENENGSLAMAGGLEGMMVSLIAEKLNFRIIVKKPQVLNWRNSSEKSTIFDEVASGVTDMGISRLRQSQTDLHKGVIHSVAYDNECVAWAVPSVNGNNDFLWGEFTLGVWILIGLAFAVSCVGAYAYHKVSSLKKGNRKDVGLAHTVLDMVSINLGNSVAYIPVTAGGKLMLMICLFYTTVTTTGYKTSLSAFLATVKISPTIDDIEGIFEANFSVGGSQYEFVILKDQAENHTLIKKLVERYEVMNDSSMCLDRLRTEKNFACHAPWSVLSFSRRNSVALPELPFYGFDDCTLTYSTVMAFPKSSNLLKPINDIILNLLASGILEYWDDRVELPYKTLETESASLLATNRKMQYMKLLLLYCVCLLLCLLVFAVELLIPFIKSKQKHRKPLQRGIK